MGRAMKRAILLVAASVSVAGCSTTDMGNFVGQPLQAAVVRYGEPTNIIDMPDGRRAFQWERVSQISLPETSTTRANVYAPPGAYRATVNSQTTTYAGRVVDHACLYTMYARWDVAAKAWMFVGYEKPNLMC